MSWQLITEPIDRWPDKVSTRSRSPFKASYADTIELLGRELDHLRATGPVVMQVVTRNGAYDLRRDGLLRAQAKIEHPGVRLSFKSKHGQLTYSTDAFDSYWSGDMPGWQANLRAIALGLEALRKVDRYGIARSGEQYRGWSALPAGTGQSASDMTREQAAAIIATHSVDPPGEPDHDVEVRRILSSVDAARTSLRYARASAHPDRNNGDRTHWDEVEAAAKVLQLI